MIIAIAIACQCRLTRLIIWRECLLPAIMDVPAVSASIDSTKQHDLQTRPSRMKGRERLIEDRTCGHTFLRQWGVITVPSTEYSVPTQSMLLSGEASALLLCESLSLLGVVEELLLRKVRLVGHELEWARRLDDG